MAYHDCIHCGGACYCGGDIDDCPTGDDCVAGCGSCAAEMYDDFIDDDDDCLDCGQCDSCVTRAMAYAEEMSPMDAESGERF